jgi:hypothetical protein
LNINYLWYGHIFGKSSFEDLATDIRMAIERETEPAYRQAGESGANIALFFRTSFYPCTVATYLGYGVT